MSLISRFEQAFTEDPTHDSEMKELRDRTVAIMSAWEDHGFVVCPEAYSVLVAHLPQNRLQQLAMIGWAKSADYGFGEAVFFVEGFMPDIEYDIMDAIDGIDD